MRLVVQKKESHIYHRLPSVEVAPRCVGKADVDVNTRGVPVVAFQACSAAELATVAGAGKGAYGHVLAISRVDEYAYLTMLSW